MPSNIKNYTSQTNSHKGYTIEELRKLFAEGNQLSHESLIQLINHAFNYELVSGNGIRIVELKNNEFKSNTTKTYRIEAVEDNGSGSGSGSENVKAAFGVIFDTENKVADKNTIIADLYDYTESGTIDTEGIYPVSLSADKKLVVDVRPSDIETKSEAKYEIHEFANTVLDDNFHFTAEIDGNKIKVTKVILQLIKEIDSDPSTDAIIQTDTYEESSSIVINFNEERTLEEYLDCPAEIDAVNPDSSITIKGKIIIEYKINGTTETIESVSKTVLVHPIYFGYTPVYSCEDEMEKHPSRRNNYVSQPYFKVYSSHYEQYETIDNIDYRKNAKVNNDYNVEILNTEKNNNYILGNYEENSETLRKLTSKNRFVLSLGEISVPFFWTILIPSSCGKINKATVTVNESMEYDYTNTMIEEPVILENKKYDNNDSPKLKYTAYTLAEARGVGVESISIKCKTTR